MNVIKQYFDLAVVMPLGPSCKPEFIADSISSLQHYSRADHKIILADDSQKGTGRQIKEQFPQIDVLTTKRSMGKLCGLYVTLCQAFDHALNHYRFRALLRMDTDALIIGKAPEQEALQLFKDDSRIGIAGQYPYDYEGNRWDTAWPKMQVVKLTQTRQLLYRPYAHWLLRKLYRRALSNGYVTGESVFGGACFISEPCLKKLQVSGLLPKAAFHAVNLEEDHLFAILVRALGFTLGDLSSQHLPFGCAWKGLPASPEELYSKGKKIIHSTRFWQQMKEEEIREWFRNKRKENDN